MATGNIAEKVRKLLAKASSQNEHEAQAALLKARELMARYKLTEKDVKDADPASRELVKTFFEEVYFSNKVHVWLPRLADVVASNHCCGHFIATYGGEKRIIGFAGLGEDSVIAQDVFRYAVRFVLDRVKEKRKEINRDYYSQQHRNKLALIFEQNYAEGFLLGLKEQYEEQDAEQIEENRDCVALAMVVPKEVKDFLGTLKEDDAFQPRKFSRDSEWMAEGFRDGRVFQPVKQITEGACAVWD